MNLQDKINNIRNKPEHIRIRYAWGYSIAATLLIVVVWVISSLATKPKETPNNSSPTPISGSEVMNQLKDTKNSIQNVGNEVKTQLENEDDISESDLLDESTNDSQTNRENTLPASSSLPSSSNLPNPNNPQNISNPTLPSSSQ